MQKMVDDWDEIVFNTSQYRDTGVHILAAVDEIQTTPKEIFGARLCSSDKP